MMTVRLPWFALVGLVVGTMGCPIEYTVPLESEGTGEAESEAESEADDESDADDDTCEPPELECDDTCVDVRNDPDHCGECNDDCGPGGSCEDGECIDACDNTCDEVVEVCVAAECECRPDFERCDGTCVDLDSDPLNCGECDELCVESEDKEIELYLCQAGDCIEDEYGCDDDLAECGQSCVDLQTHPLHCNACNRACDGDEVCIDGQCLDT